VELLFYLNATAISLTFSDIKSRYKWEILLPSINPVWKKQCGGMANL